MLVLHVLDFVSGGITTYDLYLPPFQFYHMFLVYVPMYFSNENSFSIPYLQIKFICYCMSLGRFQSFLFKFNCKWYWYVSWIRSNLLLLKDIRIILHTRTMDCQGSKFNKQSNLYSPNWPNEHTKKAKKSWNTNMLRLANANAETKLLKTFYSQYKGLQTWERQLVFTKEINDNDNKIALSTKLHTYTNTVKTKIPTKTMNSVTRYCKYSVKDDTKSKIYLYCYLI